VVEHRGPGREQLGLHTPTMKQLFVFFVLLSLSLGVPLPDAEPDAAPAAYASDYTHYVPVQTVAAPAPPSSQYHAQDDVGQYNFGFASTDQTKQEVKTADGVVRGAYSYVDANGIVQSVNYIADALGFRVAATNLPVHDVPTEDVAVATPAVETPVVQAAPVSVAHTMSPKIDYAYLPYAQGYDYHVAPTHVVQAAKTPTVFAAPVAAPAIQDTQYIQYAAAPVVQQAPVIANQYVQAAPVAQVAPIVHAAPVVQAASVVQDAPVVQAAPAVQVAPVVASAPAVEGTQYHAQDEAGQYSFGYNDPNSVRQEVKTADGIVRGAYRYIDTNGVVQTVEYIADAAGFRVAGTNLPIGAAEGPAPVQDTPEVAAAKQAHFDAVNAAAVAAALEPETISYDAEPLPVVAPVPTPVDPANSYVAKAVEVVADAATESVSNVASIPAFESLPPVNTYSQQVYYGAAAAPSTITYAQAPVAVPVVNTVPVAEPAKVPVATLVPAPSAPVVVAAAADGSQYHSQDDAGQYSYGYSDPNSVKQEVKTADGVIRGAYSYVDSNGIVQTVNYIADALGFRVGATNLPVHHVDTPVEQASPVEVAAAPAPVTAASTPVVSAYHTPGPVMTPAVSYAYLPYATNYGYNVNAPVVASSSVVAESTPVHSAGTPIAAAPYDASNSQYHAQDDFGQYNYGFSNPTQTKQELKTADGVTRGSYSYVDANGLVQTVNYISDAMGFRVAASNLPVHHVETPVSQGATAVVAEPTPAVEVQAVPNVVSEAEEGSGEVVAVEAPVVATAYTNNLITPQVQYSYLPYAQNYAYSSGETGYYGAAAPNTATYYGAAAAPAPISTSNAVAYTAAPVVQAAPVAQAAPVVQATPIVKAAPVVQAAPIAVATAPVAVATAPVATAAAPQGSQYHAQDDFGQYSFGYSDGNSVKQEVKTADGVVRGAYSYVDSDGIVQTVNYIADAMGFRVGATNLPVHNVDAAPSPVVVADAAPVVAAVQTAAPVTESKASVIAPQVNYAYLPYATSYGYNVPVDQPVVSETVAAPVVEAAPVTTYAAEVPIVTSNVDAANNQFHAQDDLGQYNYGFSHPTQTKQELKTADGVTRGSYSYVDANGLLQTVNYISDAMGFRVAATNLPVHHVEGNAVDVAEPVAETKTVISPAVQYAYLPYATNYGYNTAAAA